MSLFRAISRKFARREDGAVLVEFALVMPVMLLLFAATIESARMFWAYQQTISGVRDASRFFGRAASFTICSESMAPWSATLKDIVENRYAGFGGSGLSVFGGDITVVSVTATRNCIKDDGENGAPDLFEADTVIIGTVTATIRIDFPFGAIFSLFGNGLTSATTNISDQVRVYGQ